MKKKIKDIENWRIVFKESVYQIFKDSASFEDGTRVYDYALIFCDENRSIIFTGELVSFMDTPGEAFNFIIGSERKWLRIYLSFVDKINEIDPMAIIEFKEVTFVRTVPQLLECIEIE